MIYYPTANDLECLRRIRQRIRELDEEKTQAAIRVEAVEAQPVRLPSPTIYPRPKQILQLPDIPRNPELAKMERSLSGSAKKVTFSDPLLVEIPSEGQHRTQPPKDDKMAEDQHGIYQLRRDSTGWYKHRPYDFANIGAAPFMMLARQSYIGMTSLYEINAIIEHKKRIPDDDQDLVRKIKKTVPTEYHEYLDVFSKAESDVLPIARPGVDHRIKLNEGRTPEELRFNPLYKMSLEESEACKKYIVENLQKGFLESSHAPWAAPVLFVPKPGGRGLRFCVDYRKLNTLSRKDRYPLPLIDETMARIGQAKIFTKIDIRQAFHRIRMDPESEELTTFRTRYGAYKYKVLPFGLTNGPSTFQRYINDALMGYLDDFCSAYIDDILVYSSNLREHRIHVEKVLKRLRDAGLQADIDKCEFHVTETKFLGFIIGVDGIAVDPEKIEAVKGWREPSTVKGVQSFLGFCNFYRRFVSEYGRIAKPLTNLTRKDITFRWTNECQLAFEDLKKRLLEAPVLAYFSFEKPTRLETDASDGVVAGVLSQEVDGVWNPVGYFSETMQGAEHNYPIHDKELLAVVRSLRFWRSELIGIQQTPFTIITDHEALEYFGTKRLLNLRQAGWAEQLAQYNFVITYRPGSQNGGADALSRKAEDLQTSKAKKEAQRTIRIFKRHNDTDFTTDATPSELDPSLTRSELCSVQVGLTTTMLAILDEEDVTPPLSGYELVDEVLRANREDPELEVYRTKARLGHDRFKLSAGQLLLWDDRLVVAEADFLRTRVIREVHARLPSGHPGQRKTYKLLATRYWWKGMAQDSDRYVSNCLCQAAKSPRDKTPGLLHPLPIPQRSWQHLAVDFKSMPEDRYGFDNAFVVIDRLSKYMWTTPCKKTATAKDAARMFYDGPWRIFSHPETIVSDRGPQFVADFMNELAMIIGV